MHLEDFNSEARAQAERTVTTWADVPEWVAAVVRDRPYASVEALAETADRAAQSWGEAELEQALARHPRIGERVDGDGAEAAASRSEQSSMNDAPEDISAAIAAGNLEYERRFGRVFLIRAAGRSPQKMLSELQRRLRHDPATEAAEAVDQLRQIVALRLRGTFEEANDLPQREGAPMQSHLTTHVLDASSGDPAADLTVRLHDAEGAQLSEGQTDADGRLALGPEVLPTGNYALTFATGAYFDGLGRESFYPSVTVNFIIGDRAHYHVPLLLSPFAYSTYRGS